MKTISIPVNDRPDLLSKVIESINAAPGHEDWNVIFSCEPDAVIPKPIDCRSVIESRNAVHLGCWMNTFLAANLAMAAGSSLNLYLEDDYLISRDVLTLCSQWNEIGVPGVLVLRRPVSQERMDSPKLVSPCQSGLFGCGFAWRATDFVTIRETWWKRAPMWDIAMEQLPLIQWRPLLNRTHGIGVNGTHSCNATDPNLFGPAYEGCESRFTFKG